MDLTALSFLRAVIILASTAAFLRFIYVFPAFQLRHQSIRRRTRKCAHVLVVLGSGGHTYEMLDMLSKLSTERYVYRTYLVQTGDDLSEIRAEQFETNLEKSHLSSAPDCLGENHWRVLHVRRARNIHQPLLTTPASATLSFIDCVTAILNRPPPNPVETVDTPDIIITNGPATGVMAVIAGFMLMFFGLQGQGDMRSVYVESWARVKTLSLSGKILLYLGLTTRFFVQWPGLASGRAEYIGALVH